MDELTPVFKELTQHPIAFFGGFVSGLLRVKLTDDPVKSWLQEQGTTVTSTPNGDRNGNGGNNNGPQSISID